MGQKSVGVGQTKLGSLMEVLVNTAVGLIVALIAQSWYLGVEDVHISSAQNMRLVVFMTVISVFRSYVLRRFFNKGIVAFFKEYFNASWHERKRYDRADD